ncbi:MAG TPA: hypothetical protein VGX68_26315 [Thermoanaerobaculia bacterium]|jgi:hypothetical protein|nr:hypothetical protein [Thermoanaerobaculia bacterium]
MAEDDPSGHVLEVAAPQSSVPVEAAELLECLGRVRSNLDRERVQAPDLVGELLSLPGEQREEQLQQQARYHTWGVCELLVARSLEAAEPAESECLAVLAVTGADRLDPACHAAALIEDLKARAWAAAGDARRRQGDIAAAEEALRAAASCLAEGTGDLLVEARLLEFEASLRREQGRTGEAAALLKMAAARYRETGEEQLLERALAERDAILRREGSNEPHRPAVKSIS